MLLLACLAVVVVGCEKGTFCKPCKPSERAKKIDWTGLSDELKKVDFGGDATINVEEAKVVLELGEEPWKIKVANWQELADKLAEINVENAAQAQHFALVHQLHAMLSERKPPKTYNFWIWGDHLGANLCPSEMPIFVFFPHEAQLEDWDTYKSCSPQTRKSPVCPNLTLYGENLERFIDSIENCPGEEMLVRLRGFASSSMISDLTEDQEEVLRSALRDNFKPEVRCEGQFGPKGGGARATEDHTDAELFNLLVAETRARHVEELLASAAKRKDIEVKVESAVWCSYADMDAARKVVDVENETYDGFEGMLNRRVEIEVVTR